MNLEILKKTQFLVIADRYTNEIQQARRFEKNYFLYGTNLENVLEHAIVAKALFCLWTSRIFA